MGNLGSQLEESVKTSEARLLCQASWPLVACPFWRSTALIKCEDGPAGTAIEMVNAWIARVEARNPTSTRPELKMPRRTHDDVISGVLPAAFKLEQLKCAQHLHQRELPNYAVLTSIVRGLASSALGKFSVNTPCLRSAEILLASTRSFNSNCRKKLTSAYSR